MSGVEHTYDARDNAGTWAHDDETPCPALGSCVTCCLILGIPVPNVHRGDF